jgi:hypothetical protein
MRRSAILLFLALPAAADTLTDTRTALSRLGAQEAIRATYEIKRNAANEGRFNNDKFVATAAVQIESDRNGLRVHFSRTLLEQAEKEQLAQNKNSKATTPVLSVLSEIEPVGTAAVVDFAPSLLRMIENAKTMEDRGGTFAGKPAHILILKLADPPETGFGKRTYTENKLTLWLNDDKLPLGAELNRTAKFSFLVIRFQSVVKRSWHFATVGDRLVATRFEATESGNGMGQKVNETVLETVSVH